MRECRLPAAERRWQQGRGREMSGTASVSERLLEYVIPPREYFALEMKSGQSIRIVDIEGQQVLDYVAFNAMDLSEKLSMTWTRIMNRSWRIAKNHVLYSNRGAAMFKVTEDTVGVNYAGGGFCTDDANYVRYGIRKTRNCGDNLVNALAPYGISRGELDDGCCFNIFMNVAYDPDGTFEIRLPESQAGDYMDLEAQMDLIVGMSNCPQERNPCNGFRPTPLKIELYAKSARRSA
jgi:uncharacterized protein